MNRLLDKWIALPLSDRTDLLLLVMFVFGVVFVLSTCIDDARYRKQKSQIEALEKSERRAKP